MVEKEEKASGFSSTDLDYVSAQLVYYVTKGQIVWVRPEENTNYARYSSSSFSGVMIKAEL